MSDLTTDAFLQSAIGEFQKGSANETAAASVITAKVQSMKLDATGQASAAQEVAAAIDSRYQEVKAHAQAVAKGNLTPDALAAGVARVRAIWAEIHVLRESAKALKAAAVAAPAAPR